MDTCARLNAYMQWLSVYLNLMAILSVGYPDGQEASNFADQSGVFEIVNTSSYIGKVMRQVQWGTLRCVE